jgi:hypothetical protein
MLADGCFLPVADARPSATVSHARRHLLLFRRRNRPRGRADLRYFRQGADRVSEHLIHIGYAKAGSTFLKLWFESHPEIAYSKHGIAGFADIHDISKQAADPSSRVILRVSSSEALATPHPWAGGIPDYLSERQFADGSESDRACRELAAVFRGASVLLVTRGFRSMMLSSYSQYVRTGGGDEFFGAIPDFGSSDATRHAWNYDRLIESYRAAFGDRLIVLPYEMLRDHPQRFTGYLSARFGLSHHPMPKKRINVSLSPMELRWYPRIARLLVRLPLGASLKRRCLSIYARIAYRNLLRQPIRLLQWIFPLEPLNESMIGEDVLRAFSSKATSLRSLPSHAEYAEEYLFHVPR